MNPIMKPPPVKRLRIENISTTIEPVLTLDGSPELIITAPIMTIIPKITPRTAMKITKAPRPPKNGAIIKRPPNRPARIELINDPMRIRIPPIRDSTKAAVGRSPGMRDIFYNGFKSLSDLFSFNITLKETLY